MRPLSPQGFIFFEEGKLAGSGVLRFGQMSAGFRTKERADALLYILQMEFSCAR
jgi:hypothetical protein